jgi:hypothetical protein
MRDLLTLSRQITSKEETDLSYSISTLLKRNLQGVFGEGDPERRLAVIDEIYTEDVVFYDPNKGGLTWPRRDRSHRRRSQGNPSRLHLSANC